MKVKPLHPGLLRHNYIEFNPTPPNRVRFFPVNSSLGMMFCVFSVFEVYFSAPFWCLLSFCFGGQIIHGKETFFIKNQLVILLF